MLALHIGDTPALVQCPTPCPGPGDALVRVALAGICGTDIAMLAGYAAPMAHAAHASGLAIGGHEFVGAVEACDDATWIGRRVVGEINIGCGVCAACVAGNRGHCPSRAVIGIRRHDGCFASHVVVPVINLHAVPDHVPDELAVFTEPLAAALRILEQVPLRAGDPVTVVGDGRLGLLIAMALLQHGCRVTVVGRTPRKLEIARSLGAIDRLAESTTMRSHPVVVDATGSREGLLLALGLVARRGTVVLKSSLPDAVAIATEAIVVDEITVVGSRCGPFAAAMRLLASGAVDPRVLIDHVVPLVRGVEAFALARTTGVLKVLLDARDPALDDERDE